MTAGKVWAAGFLQVMRAWIVPPSAPESLGTEGTVYQVGYATPMSEPGVMGMSTEDLSVGLVRRCRKSGYV